MYLFIKICACRGASHECRWPWRPEDDTGSPGAGSCRWLWAWHIRAGNWTLVLCKDNKLSSISLAQVPSFQTHIQIVKLIGNIWNQTESVLCYEMPLSLCLAEEKYQPHTHVLAFAPLIAMVLEAKATERRKWEVAYESKFLWEGLGSLTAWPVFLTFRNVLIYDASFFPCHKHWWRNLF